MKTEKPQKEKVESAKEVETKKFDLSEEREVLDYEKDALIQETQRLLSQNAATLDFEDDGFGEPKSVTVRRILDNSIVFYSEERRDIMKFLNMKSLD